MEETGKKIERYAEANIPRSKDEYGQFMYHAELIKRGRITASQEDRVTLPQEYQEILRKLIQGEM